MKKFLIKIFSFLALLFVLAFLLQILIDRGLKKDNTGDYKEWNDILQGKVNADILIMGSSRAVKHISPYYIDSAFHVNSYNIGMQGFEFHMEYYRFILYLKYNKAPKYIIQTIDGFSTLNKRTDLYHFTQFIPYLGDSVIRKAVSTYEGFDWRDLYIPLYKYHSSYEVAYQGIKDNFRKSWKDKGDFKGFLGDSRRWGRDFLEYKLLYPNGYRNTIDKNTNDLFVEYLDFCKKNNIKIIFVCTPEYYESQRILLNRDSIMGVFRNYSATYNIPILDYSTNSLCLDTNNYYNSQHLNNMGAKKFNKILINDLKAIIN